MLKLNTHRTFKAPVEVVSINEDGIEVTGSFGATFKIKPSTEVFTAENKNTRLLDIVLVKVNEDDLDIKDEDGKRLEGDALLEALKVDPDTAKALVDTYYDNIGKKSRGRI